MNLAPEERNGFLISAEMKKVWHVEMQLLNKLLEVCNKHHLKVWAEGGSLLGTVRERGFINGYTEVYVKKYVEKNMEEYVKRYVERYVKEYVNEYEKGKEIGKLEGKIEGKLEGKLEIITGLLNDPKNPYTAEELSEKFKISLKQIKKRKKRF